jgi:hypothetical protein
VKLISDHVPDKRDEELADVSGQFNIVVAANQLSTNNIVVSCDFLEN